MFNTIFISLTQKTYNTKTSPEVMRYNANSNLLGINKTYNDEMISCTLIISSCTGLTFVLSFRVNNTRAFRCHVFSFMFYPIVCCCCSNCSLEVLSP